MLQCDILTAHWISTVSRRVVFLPEMVPGNVNLKWPRHDAVGFGPRWWARNVRGWLLAPEDAGGVFVDLGEQVLDVGRGVE